MKTELDLFERKLTLHRFPKLNTETLQAWDAGDEYLIKHVEELSLPHGSHVVILNDNFGALSCWFANHYKVTMMSDSFIAHQGTLSNLNQNNCPEISLLTTFEDIPEDADLVLMQIPKSNRHLKWQLSQLRKTLHESVPFIAVNKAKEIHTSTLKLFERYLGTTKTSLAWKKHRLVFAQADSTTIEQINPITRWSVDNEDFHLDNLPNVYSGEGLDLGARFFLKHLPQDASLQNAIDLGCGNGVLSVKLGQLNPELSITCVDESFMAIESARRNVEETLGAHRDIKFAANNCLDGFDNESYDLVMCNPPFHQQQAVTDHIAWQMFCDSKKVLTKGGKLLVIGNQHLGYENKLVRLFDRNNVKLVTRNNKFVILQAIR